MCNKVNVVLCSGFWCREIKRMSRGQNNIFRECVEQSCDRNEIFWFLFNWVLSIRSQWLQNCFLNYSPGNVQIQARITIHSFLLENKISFYVFSIYYYFYYFPFFFGFSLVMYMEFVLTFIIQFFLNKNVKCRT